MLLPISKHVQNRLRTHGRKWPQGLTTYDSWPSVTAHAALAPQASRWNHSCYVEESNRHCISSHGVCATFGQRAQRYVSTHACSVERTLVTFTALFLSPRVCIADTPFVLRDLAFELLTPSLTLLHDTPQEGVLSTHVAQLVHDCIRVLGSSSNRAACGRIVVHVSGSREL